MIHLIAIFAAAGLVPIAGYADPLAPFSTDPNWIIEADQNAGLGFSVSNAGDVNGDGYSDIIVGALGYTNGESGEGRAYVYHGGPHGLIRSPAWMAESDQVGALFGSSVAGAGDVNGDGFADVIVGARSYGDRNEGAAFVYLGSATGLSEDAAWMAKSERTFAMFGNSVSTAGDVNGDGFSDVIIGAPFEGRAYLYLGSNTGLDGIPSWSGTIEQNNSNFGWSVSGAGDINGDGYDDVVVGAVGFDGEFSNEGRAFAYLGSPSGLELTYTWSAGADQSSAGYGWSVANAGDVNNDGYSDVIVGAQWYNNIGFSDGRAYLYLGSNSGLSDSADWTAEPNNKNANFGVSVAGAGDVNNDGYADVLVGANLFEEGEFEEGKAYLYLGKPEGLALDPIWTKESNMQGSALGTSVSTAGDINKDGYDDIVLGAHKAGQSYVFIAKDKIAKPSHAIPVVTTFSAICMGLLVFATCINTINRQ